MEENRTASIERNTAETQIALSLNIDGSGRYAHETPIPFLNHMLDLFAKHALLDVELKATGDVEVDYHHLVEDVGIVLGSALKDALGERKGINRYGSVNFASQ